MDSFWAICSTLALKSSRPTSVHSASLSAQPAFFIIFSGRFHLLLALARRHPRLKEAARRDVERFVSNDMFRSKDATPDLGALLAATSLCAPLEDAALRDAFRDALLDEALARNVMWSLKKQAWLGAWPRGEAVSPERLGAFFDAARTSITVISFQCFFLGAMSTVAPHEGGLPQLDASFGRASAAIRAALQRARDAIRGFRHYGDFAAFVGADWSPMDTAGRLRNAVRKSTTRGYTPWLRGSLQGRLEPEALRAGGDWDAAHAAWTAVRDDFYATQAPKRSRVRRTASAPLRRATSSSSRPRPPPDPPLPPPPPLRRELSEEGRRLLRAL